jgi:dTDP-4-amino-4,6-dideoxy-D-galactose acyltransferase
MLAMEKYRILDWDTNFLGYKVASILLNSVTSIELAEILDCLKKENVKLAYLQLTPSDIYSNNAAVENNGVLADEKTVFSITLNPNILYDVDSHIEYYKGNVINEDIYNIAIESGHQSRFRIDNHFATDVQEKMYRIWIEKSINGEMADEVIVYIEDNKVLGLVTVQKKNNIGIIGLVGVIANARSKGIGLKLMEATKDWFVKNKILYIEVVTQALNIGACRYYVKSGFEIKEVSNYYHIWI